MTEQEKIEQAAKKLFPKEVVIGKPNTEQFTFNRLVEIQRDAFADGASYYEKECMPGRMVEFARWVTTTGSGLYRNVKGVWCHWGTDMLFAENDAQLLEKFFEQSKQKDNGNETNKT